VVFPNAYTADGALLENWEFDWADPELEIRSTLVPPVLAAVDRLPGLDVVWVGSGIYPGATVKVFDARQEVLLVWEHPEAILGKARPAIGDADRDGALEVYLGDQSGYLFRIDLDGSSAPSGWPVLAGGTPIGTVIIDLDGDDDREIIAGCDDGKLYAWHHDASPVAGWPITVGGMIQSTPAIADLDGDGDLELIVGTGNGDQSVVTVLDLPNSKRSGQSDWVVYQGNRTHTGVYSPDTSWMVRRPSRRIRPD
jgi:hypothetical protein